MTVPLTLPPAKTPTSISYLKLQIFLEKVSFPKSETVSCQNPHLSEARFFSRFGWRIYNVLALSSWAKWLSPWIFEFRYNLRSGSSDLTPKKIPKFNDRSPREKWWDRKTMGFSALKLPWWLNHLLNRMTNGYIKLLITELPSWELTFPTFGKGKSSSNVPWGGIC